ncbi:MAG: DUF1826 domain-containing protein [Verrucomicrobiota bacterium]
MSFADCSSNYSRIKWVSSFQELVDTPFADGINALCWQRTLPGDFGEVVRLLGPSEDVTPIDETRLRTLPVSEAGRVAVEILHEDLRTLQDHGAAPVLNCFLAYPRDDEPQVVATDVYSFHADRAPVEADTFLCTYHGASSEGLRNEDAQRYVDLPETHAELLKLFGGADGEEFRQFLAENCYDLHYAAAPGAQPFSFGVGNLWRIATEWPGSPVPPCIHRAPPTLPGQPARLLLIC